MLISALVILLILLSGYWFGFKEGFFSGVVHLVCVLVAGAMTFAFWEPLAMTMLSSQMGEFAWGLSFLGLFCFILIVLRIATNFIIPTRQNYPPAVDYSCGTIVGLAIGIATAGMGLIGVGFLPLPPGRIRRVLRLPAALPRRRKQSRGSWNQGTGGTGTRSSPQCSL